MPAFTIKDIFKITDRGHVLSGIMADNSRVQANDNIVLKNGFDSFIFKITGVSIEKQKRHFGVLISSSDFEKVSSWELKEKDTRIVHIADRQKTATNPIVWTGDLDDDCTAEWAGLLLRAEWMDEDYWWWEVSDMENPEIEIDSSNNYEIRFIGGNVSRLKAEEVARKYLNK